MINCEPPSTNSGRADVETYIHRSGRTGRAGKKGVCITLSTGLQQEATMKAIEKAVGNAFSRVGAPQPADLLCAKAERLAGQLDNIDHALLEKMKPLAERCLEREEEVTTLVARCLCLAVGATGKIKSRSILTSHDGRTEGGVSSQAALPSPTPPSTPSGPRPTCGERCVASSRRMWWRRCEDCR